MLKLVVNSSSIQAMDKLITSRNSCELFDPITERCSIKENAKIDSPYEASRCGHFMSKESMFSHKEHVEFKFSLIEDDNEYLIDDEEIVHELIGNKGKLLDKSTSTYPLEPDFPSKRNDVIWFVSSDGRYGCWIINQCRRPLTLPASKERAEKGWSEKVYKSPIPLHDHKTSLPLASKMAWVIDEGGYGQYNLLVNGKVSTISSPKPSNWQK